MVKEFKLLGFQFDKILVEKDPEFKGKISNPSSDINIKSVEKHNISLIKEDSIKITFSFTLKFGDLGKLEMFGNLVILLDEDSKKKVLEDWKTKKMPEDIRLTILNLILQRSSLKALHLEEEVGLPLHIQLPKLQIQSKKEDKS